MRRLLLLLLVAATLGVVSPGSGRASGAAPATCGDTISSSGVYALSGNCSGAGISIGANNVTLLLKGHTMTGGGNGIGIAVEGSESNVRIEGHGTIRDYADGIVLDGVTGSHIDYVKVVESTQTGIQMSASQGNFLNWDVSNGNGFEGFLLASGSTTNRLDNDVANGNGDNGMTLVDSSDNVVSESAVKFNGVDGIEVVPVGHPADGNTIRRNVVNSNTQDGINLADGTTSNSIVKNRAHGNGDYDLFDANGSCGGNTWSGNVAGSSSLCQR